MTVETTTIKQQFALNQVTDEFDFTFRALTSAPTDIKARALTGSTEVLLTYTTDYTVTVSTDGIGGIVWLVDPTAISKGTLTVYRDTTDTQESDYDDYNQFPAQTMETDLDKRTMRSQEQDESLARSLVLPISTTGVSNELPAPVAETVIGWDSAGTALANYEVASLALPAIAIGDAQKVIIIDNDNTSYAYANTLSTFVITHASITSLTVGTQMASLSVNTITITNATIGNISATTLTVATAAITSATVGNVSATTLTVGNITITNATISGTLTFSGDLNVDTITASNIDLSGNISAVTATLGTIAVTTATISGNSDMATITGSNVSLSGNVSAATATVATVVLTTATITGNSSVVTVTASNISLTNATISGNTSMTTVTASNIDLSGNANAVTATLGTITVTNATISGNVTVSTIVVGTSATIVTVATGAGDNDQMATKGYVDDNVSGAVSVFAGSFTRDQTVATGTQAIAGVGFTPKAVIFFASDDVAAGKFSVGVDDGSTPGSAWDQYTATAGLMGPMTSSIAIRSGAGVRYEGTISVLGADGFTVSWVRTGAPTGTVTVKFLAIG